MLTFAYPPLKGDKKVSTRALLEQAVVVGSDLLHPQLTDMDAYLRSLSQVPEERLTEQEIKLLKVWHAKQDGLQLINLQAAITAGGVDAHRRPKLAVAPYRFSLERRKAQALVNPNGSVRFMGDYGGSYISFPENTLPSWERFLDQIVDRRFLVETTVPVVPPAIRLTETHPGSPREFFVLFEAQEWRDLPLPSDPALLWRISGFVCAVIDLWDVTETEVRALKIANELDL